jgi:putative molybdopterin biosynthesis protein
MQANATALRAWASGRTHIAGVHFPDAEPQNAARVVARHLPTDRGTLHAFAKWEAGLVVAPGNPRRIRDVTALVRGNVRCALREEGAGARVQLVRLLRERGLELSPILPRSVAATSHWGVAQAVQLGAADAGFAIRAVALAFGLDFVPLVEERFDLALTDDLAGDARTERMFDVLASRAFRRELTELGYDAANAGQKLIDITTP